MTRRGRLLARTAVALAILALPAWSWADPQEAEVHLTNKYGAAVEVFWLDSHGNGRSAGVLKDGENMYLDTVVGRVWVIRSTGAKRVELRRFTVAKTQEEVVLQAPRGSRKEPKPLPPPAPKKPEATKPEPKKPEPAPPAPAKPEPEPKPTPTKPVPPKPAPPRANLEVVNHLREAIALLEVRTNGSVMTRAVLDPGKRWSQATRIGAAWRVIRVADNETLESITITKTTQTVTLEPPEPTPEEPVPPTPDSEPVKPKPEPEPAKQPTPPTDARSGEKTITVKANIHAIGVWAHVRGDSEMDTDGRDRVPVSIRSLLYFDDDGVHMYGYFSCSEYGGDGTTFQGPRRSFEVATHKNGRIEAGWRVVGIDATGGLGTRVDPVSYGRQHGFQSVGVAGTYWDSLAYRVDGRGRGDGSVVGFQGSLTVTVKLQKTP